MMIWVIWWLFEDYLIDYLMIIRDYSFSLFDKFWWLFVNYLLITWWLFDDYSVTIWWFFGDYLVIIWLLFDDYLMTIRDYLMIIWSSLFVINWFLFYFRASSSLRLFGCWNSGSSGWWQPFPSAYCSLRVSPPTCKATLHLQQQSCLSWLFRRA